MRKRRGNMAANRVGIRVHSGESVVFDDERDFHFLTLLSEDIQDDQVNVITEGLQLQKALASSLIVYDSDEGEEDETSDGKLSPESALLVDDSAVGEEILSFLGKTLPLIITYSDDADEDENSAGKSASALEIDILSDDSAVEEENRSFLDKALRLSLKTTDSGDTDGEKIAAGKSSPKSALLSDDSVAEENSAKSLSKTALIPDHSPAEDENWSFVEKSSLTSLKITDSADTNDFASKDQNWAIMNEFCQLCTAEERMRKLIRVYGCGHYFCNYCFEWYTSGELGSENCSIKCPAETCFNQIESDHCVALLLQHSYDTRGGESISDWEFLDSPNIYG